MTHSGLINKFLAVFMIAVYFSISSLPLVVFAQKPSVGESIVMELKLEETSKQVLERLGQFFGVKEAPPEQEVVISLAPIPTKPPAFGVVTEAIEVVLQPILKVITIEELLTRIRELEKAIADLTRPAVIKPTLPVVEAVKPLSELEKAGFYVCRLIVDQIISAVKFYTGSLAYNNPRHPDTFAIVVIAQYGAIETEVKEIDKVRSGIEKNFAYSVSDKPATISFKCPDNEGNMPDQPQVTSGSFPAGGAPSAGGASTPTEEPR